MSAVRLSVVVLTFRRRDALVKVLDSVRAQALSDHELIVVDNGSEDGIEEFLLRTYPEVQLVQATGNPGCGGRNLGVQAALGEFVVTLDNDVHLDSPFELEKIVKAFERWPQASCLVFQVLDGVTGEMHPRDWCHPRDIEKYANTEFETNYIPEGACAFRRDRFLQVGGYYTPLWIGCEGWDLGLRLLGQGGSIVYIPSVHVRHLMSGETRTSWRPFYYYTRNYVWIAVRHYPFLQMVPYLMERLGMMAAFSWRTGNLNAFLRGLWDGLSGLPRLWKTRVPLPRQVWRELRRLAEDRPGWVARLRKHRERPLI